MNSIKEVITEYSPKLKKAINAPNSSLYLKLNKEMEEQMSKVINAENEIVKYYREGIQTGDWRNKTEWELATIVHPSDRYFKYFSKILKTNNNTYPHWFILDILAFMPTQLHSSAANIIKRAIDSNNPSWSNDDLKKAFEALIWIGEEEDIQFIQQKCQSKYRTIANMAKYWVNWLNDGGEDE